MNKLFKAKTFRDKYLAVTIASILVSFSAFSQVKVGTSGAIEPMGNYPALRIGNYQTGSYPVTRLTERDSIPSYLRVTGMSVYVHDNDSTYRLKGGILNANWVNATAGTIAAINNRVAYADTATMLTNYRTSINSNAVALPYKNVLSYNAVGNNVTSDATAFTNALSGGGAVYVPAGKTYYLTSQVDIPAKTHLIIDGVVRFAQGINGFRVTGDSVSIEGNGIIQGATTASVDNLTAGLFLNSGKKKFLTVRNITFRNWGLCVSLAVIDNPSFDNVKFLDFRTTSVYAAPTNVMDIQYLSVTNCTMRTSIGNYSSGLAGKGIYLGGYKPYMAGCFLDGGAFEQGGVVGGTATGLRDGIWLPGSQYFKVIGNTVRNFGDDGITAYQAKFGEIGFNTCTASQQTVGVYYLGTDTSYVGRVEGVYCHDNTLDSNALYGGRTNYAFRCKFSHNTYRYNGSPEAYAVNSYAGTGLLIESSGEITIDNETASYNYQTGVTVKTVNNHADLLTANYGISITNGTYYRNGLALPSSDRAAGVNIEGDATLYHPEVPISNTICYDNGKNAIRYLRVVSINGVNNTIYNTDSINKLPQVIGIAATSVLKIRETGLKAYNNANYGVSAGVETPYQTYTNCDASSNGNGITNGIVVGSGFLVYGTTLRFINCEGHSNYYGGINWNPTSSTHNMYVNGGSYTNNGIRSGTGSGVGIRAVGSGGNLYLNGVRFRDTATATPVAQLFGVNHNGLTFISNINSDNNYTYGYAINGTASSTYKASANGNAFEMTTPRFSVGSDGKWDMYMRDSATGNIVRIPTGTSGQQMIIVNNKPTWVTPTAITTTITDYPETAYTDTSSFSWQSTTTPPGGQDWLTYEATSIGNHQIMASFHFKWTTAAVSAQTLTFKIPSALPAPLKPLGYNDGEQPYSGYGGFKTAYTSMPNASQRIAVKTISGVGYVTVSLSSGSAVTDLIVTITYKY